MLLTGVAIPHFLGMSADNTILEKSALSAVLYTGYDDSSRFPGIPTGLPLKNVPKATSRLIFHVLTAARYLKPRRWKTQLPPTISDLHAHDRDIRSLEYLTARLQNTLEHFEVVWPCGILPLMQGLELAIS